MNWLQLLSPYRSGDHIDFEVANNSRSRFEQDYDRLIFSHPFRRLQDKTQVFPLPEDDFVHTRLTHSLEVSSVGRSLGKAVGERLILKHSELAEKGYTFHDFGGIVAAASLAHDLGNPPFGHAGETAISSFFTDNEKGKSFENLVEANQWSDLISFEGNAQGFRILSDPDNSGLKLTYASLGAFTKYPKSSYSLKIKGRKSQKKYGFYRNELPQFSELADRMGLKILGEKSWCRHPLAFLVEAADDICYGIIDLEDGTRLGLVDYEVTKRLLADIIGDQFQEDKLDKAKGQNEKIGYLRAMAIGQLLQQSVQVFLDNEEGILSGEFDAALTDLIPAHKALDAISALSVEKIYRSKQVLEREVGGFEVIGRLMESFCIAAHAKNFDSDNFTPKMESTLRLLPHTLTEKMQEDGISVYQMLLIITDFISGLTDSHAIKLYKIIYGFSLPFSKA